jgi:hypothetical protein
LEYDGNTNTLRANTRNGSKLVYDKESLLEALYDSPQKGFTERDRESNPFQGYNDPNRTKDGKAPSALNKNRPTWEKFVLSKYAG